MITDTKKLEDGLLNEIFKDGQVHNYREIRELGKKILGEDYTDGKLSGLLNKLKKNNKIVSTGRGYYRKSNSFKINIKDLINKSLDNALIEIKEIIDKATISDMTDQEFKTLSEAREIFQNLQKLKILK